MIIELMLSIDVKIVVNALMFAIPAIFNVLLVCLVFWLVFSILGVQLFGGKFYKCVDDETGDRFPPQVVDSKADCLGRNLTWKNSPIHFDHVGHAYLALFQVVSCSPRLYKHCCSTRGSSYLQREEWTC